MGNSDLHGPSRLAAVLVPESALDHEHLLLRVVDFATTARHREYADDEVPRLAMLARYVCCYFGEVGNGGHKQFVGNYGWTPEICRRTREGVQAFGDAEALAVFDEFAAFTREHPARFERARTEERYHDPLLDPLDERLHQRSGALIEAGTALCRAGIGEWLLGVPDERYHTTKVVPWHPDAEARRQARRTPESRTWVGELVQSILQARTRR